MGFKENLHYFMEKKTLKTKELAYLSGLSENTIKSYLKTSSNEPTISKALQIAKALNISLDELSVGIEIKNKKESNFSEEANLYRKYAKLITALESFPQEKQKLLEESFQAVIKAAK